MFELINGNVIVSTALPGGWCDLPDGFRASPTQDGWSNDECRLAEIQGADAASEGRQVASTSGEVVDGLPRNVHVLEDAPPVDLTSLRRQSALAGRGQRYNGRRGAVRVRVFAHQTQRAYARWSTCPWSVDRLAAQTAQRDIMRGAVLCEYRLPVLG